MAVTQAEEIAAAGFLAVVFGVGWASAARAGMRRVRGERRAHKRSAQAGWAALEAALEAQIFSPDSVRRAVARVLELAQDVWDGRDPQDATGPDRQLIAVWAAAHGAGTGTRMVGEPRVDLLRVVNRREEAEDRVELRVRGEIHLGHHDGPLAPRSVHFDEHWTMQHHGDAWQLTYYDDDPFADDVLERPQITGRWDDQQRLQEHSLAELANQDRHAASRGEQSLADLTDTPYRQLLDLSVIDGRFMPELIHAIVTHLIEAWEESAVDDDRPLAAITTKAARGTLLRPGPQARSHLALRDAQLLDWKVATVSATSIDTHVDVNLRLSAIRVLYDRETGAHVAGSLDIRHEISLRWRLEPTDSIDVPWRLLSTSDPSADIPNKPWD